MKGGFGILNFHEGLPLAWYKVTKRSFSRIAQVHRIQTKHAIMSSKIRFNKHAGGGWGTMIQFVVALGISKIPQLYWRVWVIIAS